MNKFVQLFGVAVAVAAFGSSAFAGNYVGTSVSTPVKASVTTKVTNSGQYVTKYDPPADAQGRTYQRMVPSTITYAWQGGGIEPPAVDIFQTATVDVEFTTSRSNANVNCSGEVQSNVGVAKSITNGSDKQTFAGEAYFGRIFKEEKHEIRGAVGVLAKASVDTTRAPAGSSGTSQSIINATPGNPRFYYLGQPTATAASAPEPGVVGRGGP